MMSGYCIRIERHVREWRNVMNVFTVWRSGIGGYCLLMGAYGLVWDGMGWDICMGLDVLLR